MNVFAHVTGLEERHKARLADALNGHRLTFSYDLKDLSAREKAVADSDVVFGNVPVAWLKKAPRLKWVQLDSAGVNAYLTLNANGSGSPVVVTNLNDFYGQAVAEGALAGILAFYRHLPELLRAQPERRWVKVAVEPLIGQVHGARIVILGAGSLGRALAKLLRAFDAEIKFFARTSPDATLRSLADLDDALGKCDIAINTLPEVPETIRLFDAPRLQRLSPDALLVNVGRGSAVDEDALLAALNAGRLAGAMLDVTAVEPLPPEHPFWTHPRVILTQHTGGRFPREREAKIDRFLENFARFARGDAVLAPVDLSRGY